MPNHLDQYTRSAPPVHGVVSAIRKMAGDKVQRQTKNTLDVLDSETIIRVAEVMADGLVTHSQVRTLAHIDREEDLNFAEQVRRIALDSDGNAELFAQRYAVALHARNRRQRLLDDRADIWCEREMRRAMR